MTLRDNAEELARSGKRSEALRLLERRVAAGDGSAALVMAHWSMIGEHVARDLAVCRAYLEQAGALGEEAAEGPLAALLANGAGGLERRWGEAMALFARIAKRDPLVARQSALLAEMALDERGNPARTFEPEFLSSDPLIVQFRDFMTVPECDALIALAQGRLAPATVVDPASGKLIRNPIRDCQAVAFPFLEETPFVHALNRRIAAASRSTPEQGEPTQILAYGPAQQFRLHSDTIAGSANQRIQTFLVYLTDDFEGGATHFPQPDLALRPRRGDAICFSNVTADMQPAPSARHAGLPVTSGSKIILSKWIRQRPLDLAPAAPRRPA